MFGWFWEKHIRPTDDQIRHALRMQTLASLRPERITHPVLWFPYTRLDKLIASNMLKSMSTEQALKKFAKSYLRSTGKLAETELAESLMNKDQT